jgi:glycosyltransferase involved in cell wall biosynthesis/GT2 family glycosyltransferase
VEGRRPPAGRPLGGAGILTSIVLLTWNGQPQIRGCLEAVFRQEGAGETEVLVLDSGSTDGTLDVVRGFPVRLIPVDRRDFDHGDTRNLGALHSRGDAVVFLVQDAEPADASWLRNLVAPLREDPRVAGVASRILPRPGLPPWLERTAEADPNASDERRVLAIDDPEAFERRSPLEQRLFLNYHDVSSCLRRSVWRRLPYPRLAFGEDLAWARAALLSGHRLVYEPASRVLHSHDYGPRAIYRRTFEDGRVNRRVLGRVCVRSRADALRAALAESRADRAWARTRGRSTGGPVGAARGAIHHLAAMWGFYRGGRTDHRPERHRPVPERGLRVLMVAHGFPPGTVAGTEMYTLRLARALRPRHEVAVLHRVADRERPEWSLEEGEHEGVRVFRLVNNLRYGGIGETYVNRRAEQRFREVVARFRPDLVHFQHCLHTSVSLIGVAEDLGLATVATLHDYWYICPKVQLIRPDRSLCSESYAGLACVRCASDRTRFLKAAKLLARLFPAPIRLGLALSERLERRVPALRRRFLKDARALVARKAQVLPSLNRAGALLAPSRFLRDTYVRFGVDPTRIRYLPNGVDVAALGGARREPAPRLRVGFLGSFVWYKGLEVLVDAANRLDGEEIDFRLHGSLTSPPEVAPFVGQLRERARNRSIAFPGPVPADRLRETFGALDVLVVPSLWHENCPLVILEAFAAGVPVVASRLGGMTEMVRDGVDGLLVPAGDADALAAALRRLRREPGLLDRLRAGIRPPFDVAAHVERLELVYRQEVARLRVRREEAPLAELAAREFVARLGAVEEQGADLTLLRPGGDRPASVTYRVHAPADGTYRLRVTTVLLAGEESVRCRGRVLVNGEGAGEIPVHFADGNGGGERSFTFAARLREGDNRVELRAGTGGPEAYYLRLRSLGLYPGTSENPIGTARAEVASGPSAPAPLE